LPESGKQPSNPKERSKPSEQKNNKKNDEEEADEARSESGGEGETTEELQEEAQEVRGFDSAHVSSPILIITNAKQSEASTRKARRNYKKMEEKNQERKRKKQIKRIFCRHEWRKSPRRCKGLITGASKRMKHSTAAAKRNARIRRRANRRRRRGLTPI